MTWNDGSLSQMFFSEERFWSYPKFGINVNSSRTLRTEQSNSEIDELNFLDKTAIEKVHLGFCKSTPVEVKKSSTNLAVQAELGRLPLESFIKTQTSLNLLRLNNDNINPLV